MTPTKTHPATKNTDGSYDAVFLSSEIEGVTPAISPATVQFEDFIENPVLLYRHYSDPIGQVTNIGFDGQKLVGKIHFDAEDEFAQEVEKKWQSGLIRGCSVGVDYIKNSWNLREVSVVFLPRDPGAIRAELDGLCPSELNDEAVVKVGKKRRIPPSITGPVETLEADMQQEKDAKASEPAMNSKTEDVKTDGTEKTVSEPAKVEDAKKEEVDEVNAVDAKQNMEAKQVTESLEADVDALKARYRTLLPENFHGTTAREVLAEATRMDAQDLHIKYLEGVADLLLSQRRNARQQTLDITPTATVEREYTLAEIRKLSNS